MGQKHILALLVGLVIILALAVAFLLGRSTGDGSAGAPEPTNMAGSTGDTGTIAGAGPSEADPARVPDPNSDSELTRWIVGAWAEASTRCATDTGDHFAADGSYLNYDEQGRWRIENGNLVITVTHRRNDLGDEEAMPVQQPQPELTPFIRDGQDRMTRIVDGQRYPMIRC